MKHRASTIQASRHSLHRASGGGFAALVLLCAATLALAVGCGKKEQRPKREDHEAAHTPRYHPEVKRNTHDGLPVIDTSTTRPATATRPGYTGPVGSPVLFVNGDSLTTQEILEPIRHTLAQRARQLSPVAYNNLLTQTVADQIRMHVRTLVVYQQAKNDIPEKVKEVLDEEANKLIDGVINREFSGVRARYEAHIASIGLTMDDVMENARRRILVSNYLHERFTPVLREPPRRDLMKHYQANLDQYTTPAKAEMFLIEVRLTDTEGKPLVDPTPEQLADARQKAREQIERAAEELDSGIEFRAVAKRYSQGVRKALGGAWGEIGPGTLTGRWTRPAEVLFTLAENQTSEIIETDESFFIVRCGKKTPDRRLSFEEAQPDIIVRFKDEQYLQASERYVTRLLTEAAIDPRQQQDFFYAVVAACPRPTR